MPLSSNRVTLLYLKWFFFEFKPKIQTQTCVTFYFKELNYSNFTHRVHLPDAWSKALYYSYTQPYTGK